MDTLTLLTITETCPHQHAILLTSANHVACTVHKECALHHAKANANSPAEVVMAEHVTMLAEAECMFCGDMLDTFDPEWIKSLVYIGENE